MSTDTSPPAITIDHGRVSTATALRTLYFARSGFAVVWAALVAVTASTLDPWSIALIVLYPVVDLVAAVVDVRATRAGTPAPALYVTMALSLLAAIGLAVALTAGTSEALTVWGAWAITAGAVQLIVAVTRRSLGGQWPMILSGGISVLAGVGFVLQSTRPDAPLTGIAGYAVLGGVFFLLSALRLGRTLKTGNR